MKKILAFLLIATLSITCYATLSPTYEPEQYNANGSTVAFPFQYSFFETSDLIVYTTDADGLTTTPTEGSGAGKYLITAPNNDYSDGATVTTGTTYPLGVRITIERSVPYGQQLSINGDFIPAKPLEQQLDKLAAQTQQTKDEIGRTLTIPVTDPAGLDTEFPEAEERASKLAAFDASGNAIVVDPIDSGTIVVDDVTLEQTALNVLQVKDGGIGDDQLAASFTLPTNSVVTVAITNGAVTLAKMADLSNLTVIGRTTAGSGVPEEVVINDDDTLATASDTTLATDESIKAYVDASDTDGFTPAAYVGAESATLPNGMIMKSGIKVSASTSGSIAFAVAFPTALVSLSITTDGGTARSISAHTESAAGFSYEVGGALDGVFWQAIGY